MCHPKRERFVPGLLDELPGAEVVWDREDSRWETGRRSLLAFDPDADWHLVVQDDAVLCPNFLAGVRAALAQVPTGHPASFYVGKTKPYVELVNLAVERAVVKGASWIEMPGPFWGVAIALPTDLIEDVVCECDTKWIENYDTRIFQYFHDRGLRCWYSLPSLVDHRTGDENPSLVEGRSNDENRTAHRFLTTDPAEIDWGAGAVHFRMSSVTKREGMQKKNVTYIRNLQTGLIFDVDDATLARCLAERDENGDPVYEKRAEPKRTTTKAKSRSRRSPKGAGRKDTAAVSNDDDSAQDEGAAD